MKAETLLMFSLILACLVFNVVFSRSMHALNKGRNMDETFSFQPRREEIGSRNLEGQEERFEDWSEDNDGDSRGQACKGIRGGWFC